jgi:hypothetical protein
MSFGYFEYVHYSKLKKKKGKIGKRSGLLNISVE